MRSWVLALTLCACGDVNKAPPDAPSPDAYQADAALSCGSSEMVCAGACANVMTSDQHCGNCDTQCAPNQGCSNGTCIAAGVNCANIKLLNPSAADGVYTNPNNGVTFYCNMETTPPTSYFELGFGQWNSSYPGFTTVTVAELQDVAAQNAFIFLYNKQGGARNLQPGWNSGNCCFASTQDKQINFAGSYLYPATGATQQCSTGYTAPVYQFYMFTAGAFSPLPLPPDFFATHAVTEGVQCGQTGTNPGWFFRK